ncbi:enoyl-CoA hydratase/isomerase family protein [Amycolatopsis rubida]|uniref:Enoyl-CoA hydratase/isomerase family protein n=1 Tax=Amycolatopsis rubida TaxID=112413 RepID=A0ABX0BU62_9PSEU|nr:MULTISPECIES: enoyl-CoA hydratase/isomerase family protein [Amycolatopsis]MYW93902.1 enoyl-CoA hydratase/isomerase family protein [Amycolatopsis rubida]NEC58891.1 enoyl-CoA hydratase/isomerase family protein [Amycolatopsis rubida]OAP25398.1 1,4-Dihydroxy-2-naphthoyl-CoA synthase [Amycolatopsis sp. M39]
MSERYQHGTGNVLVERPADGVLLITINRPERYNALLMPMFEELSEVWADVERDDETRVVVVTGAGKAFCTGMDVREPDPAPEAALAMLESERRRISTMLRIEKPIISAINGPAVGYGLSTALLADISIAAEDAVLIEGHTKVGVTAGDHAALIWPLLVGMAKTKYYVLTSEKLTGAEAERIGLVSLAVPREQVLPRALEVATQLAQGSQQALRFTKRALNIWLTNALPQHELAGALEILDFAGADYREARQAFREKRAPVFPSASGMSAT